MVDVLRWIDTETDDEAAASAAESVIDLFFGKVAISGRVSDARIGHQEAAKGRIHGQIQRSPPIDEDEA